METLPTAAEKIPHWDTYRESPLHSSAHIESGRIGTLCFVHRFIELEGQTSSGEFLCCLKSRGFHLSWPQHGASLVTHGIVWANVIHCVRGLGWEFNVGPVMQFKGRAAGDHIIGMNRLPCHVREVESPEVWLSELRMTMWPSLGMDLYCKEASGGILGHEIPVHSWLEHSVGVTSLGRLAAPFPRIRLFQSLSFNQVFGSVWSRCTQRLY